MGYIRTEGSMIMKKSDEKILKHLKPYHNDAECIWTDSYFCNIAKNNKNEFMYTVMEKVKNWVEKNGGKFERLTDKKIIGDKKGFVVKIIFPRSTKRDMKNIMATLF